MTTECRNCDYLTGRLQSAREDRDALAERADAAEQALRDLWALWCDKQVAGWNADYLRGHLSYAGMLSERTQSIRETLHRLAAPSAPKGPQTTTGD